MAPQLRLQARTLFPSFGTFWERHRGKNRELPEVNEFCKENRKDEQRCVGVYEVRLPVKKEQNPYKDVTFELNNSWVEIRLRSRNQFLVRTIKHPDNLELRIPKDLASAAFVDDYRRVFCIRLAIVEVIKDLESPKRKLGVVDAATPVPTKKQKLEPLDTAEQDKSQVTNSIEKPKTVTVVSGQQKGEIKELDVVERQKSNTNEDAAKDLKLEDHAQDAENQTTEIANAYEKSINAQFAKVPLTPPVPALHLKEDKELNEDTVSDKTESSKKKVSKAEKKRGRPKVGKFADLLMSSLKPEGKKSKVDIKKKTVKDKEKELHSKQVALVDDLVERMDAANRTKMEKVKEKLDSIQSALSHKYEKKRGREKKKEKIKKLCLISVKKDIAKKKAEERLTKYGKKKKSGVRFA